MRVVIQRVSEASVTVNKNVVGQIDEGLLVFLGVEEADTQEDIDWLVNKTLNLRIFNDTDGVMNSSLVDTNGQMLVISQFTLMASTKKGIALLMLKRRSTPMQSLCTRLFVKRLKKLWVKKSNVVCLVLI